MKLALLGKVCSVRRRLHCKAKFVNLCLGYQVVMGHYNSNQFSLQREHQLLQSDAKVHVYSASMENCYKVVAFHNKDVHASSHGVTLDLTSGVESSRELEKGS